MRTAFAIVALGVLACNRQPSSKTEGDPIVKQARAAIEALEQRDREAVAACEADVQSCFAARADGGSAAGACEELREQCDEAERALDDVRGPAVECWQTVESCARGGKPFRTGDAGAPGDAGPAAAADAGSTCEVTPHDCEEAGDGVDEDRPPILECRDAARECWRSLRSHSDDWRTQCGEVRETCSSICQQSARGGRDRGERRARVRGLLQRLRARHHGAGHHHHADADAGAR